MTTALSTTAYFTLNNGAVIRYAKPIASGTADCSSWANACTLQTALTGALSGNEIWVAAGVHKPTTGTDRSATFQLKTGVAVYGEFGGTEADRSQRNPAANVTNLSGDLNGDDVGFTNNSENSYHVVTGSNTNAIAILDGFTISGGNANGTSPDDAGGGMYNNAGSPTASNLTFSSNFATYGGGGMYNVTSANPTLTNITFTGNKTSSYGGGVGNATSSPVLNNITFNSNTSGNWGGGMVNINSSNPTLTNVTFSGNSAACRWRDVQLFQQQPGVNERYL